MQSREQDLESQYCGNVLWQGSVYGLCIFSGNFWSKFRYCACAVSCSYALASASQAPYQARFDCLIWVWYCVSLSELLVNIHWSSQCCHNGCGQDRATPYRQGNARHYIPSRLFGHLGKVSIQRLLVYLTKTCSTNLWVVFIASCIPTIRPIIVRIIHKVTGKEGNITIATGYIHEATLKGIEDDSAKSRQARTYSKVYTRGQGSSNATAKNVFESVENILPGQDGIIMTTEYQVKYEESQDSLSEKGLVRVETWKDEE